MLHGTRAHWTVKGSNHPDGSGETTTGPGSHSPGAPLNERRRLSAPSRREWLPRQDSNLERLDQNQLCCQLHHGVAQTPAPEGLGPPEQAQRIAGNRALLDTPWSRFPRPESPRPGATRASLPGSPEPHPGRPSARGRAPSWLPRCEPDPGRRRASVGPSPRRPRHGRHRTKRALQASPGYPLPGQRFPSRTGPGVPRTARPRPAPSPPRRVRRRRAWR